MSARVNSLIEGNAKQRILSLFGGLIFFTLVAFPQARAEFQVPALSGPVVDDARILDRSTQASLENALRALLEQGGTQVNVLTVASLDGMTIEQASIKVTDQWKLGTAKDDKGVLLMVAAQDRKVRIEVGQGLEGVLTDLDTKRIIEEAILPLFRTGDYGSGVTVGVFHIARKTNPDLDLSQYFEGRARAVRGATTKLPPLFILIILVILFMIGGLFGGGGRGRGMRGGMLGGLGGLGGGGFGGGGGGGWGGGGGGFSGGGASGGW